MTQLKYAAAASLLAFSAPSFSATTFDFEGVAPDSYLGSLVVVDGPTVLTITPEGNPDGFVIVSDTPIPLIGVGVVGTKFPREDVMAGDFLPLRFSFNQLIDSITFNFGDSGGEVDTPIIISAYDAADNFLGSIVETYPEDFGDGKTATLNFAGVSYYIATSTPGFNDNSVFWDISDIRARGAVPEPATWAMLIFGFGLIGGALRRSRRTVSVQYS